MKFEKGIHIPLLAFASLMFFVQIANAGWQYKRSISIGSTGTALTDYHVLVTLTTGNFVYSHANSDGSDIRFSTDSTGSSLPDIDYWIETWNTSGDSKIWVEVPSIPANGGTTIYIYYGNASASSASSGTNTFLLFDDFEYTDSPSNHDWTVIQTQGIIETSTAQAYSGSRSLRIKTVAGSGYHDYVQKTSVPSGIAEVMFYDNMVKTTNGQYTMVFQYQGSTACLMGISRTWGETGGDKYFYRFGGALYRSDVTRSLGWHKFTIKYTGSNYQIYIDDTYIAAGASGTPEYLSMGNFWDWRDYDSAYFDDVRIRKYASAEPTAAVNNDETVNDYSLPVELSTFTATSSDGKVTLHWRTESEVENLGFYIYRGESKDGSFVKVNDSMIQGAGNSAIYHEYQFTDKHVEAGHRYFYYIEDVDISGMKDRSKIIEVFVPIVLPKEIPKDFALFQNFPNPFNPDTWIPYQLADVASVEVRIYDTKGRLVRKISLGKKEAGFYKTKETAAYWDGRDNLGQPVASGIYFYQIKAGDFMKTRKMVIVK